jgi:hypothetical protein
MRVSELRLFIHDSCQAKVSNLDIAVDVKEDIPRLEVSMKNSLWS